MKGHQHERIIVCTGRTLVTRRYSLGLAITVKDLKAAGNVFEMETRLLVYRNVRSVCDEQGLQVPRLETQQGRNGAESSSMQAVSCSATAILVDFGKRSRNLFAHDSQSYASVTKAPSRALATHQYLVSQITEPSGDSVRIPQISMIDS